MSGQLVGEVIAAADSLRGRGLSERGFHALVAIADRCRVETRQASVPWSHISAGLYGASLSTCKRAVTDLKSFGAVRVVKRGFNNQSGRVCAPIYEIGALSEQVTQVAQSGAIERFTQATQSPGTERVKPGGRTGHIDDRTGHPGDLLNGSTNGSHNVSRAPAAVGAKCAGRDCITCAIIRRDIDACEDCDTAGRDDQLADCPHHGNFRLHRPRKASA